MNEVESVMQQAINEAKEAQVTARKAIGLCEELLAQIQQLQTENKTLREKL